MPESFELSEFLSDARACFETGHAGTAVDILLEALDAFDRMPEAAERIRAMLADICCSFWNGPAQDEGRQLTERVVSDALRRTGADVEPAYLALYAEACVLTGSSPFPARRALRHRNLVGLFRQVTAAAPGEVAECGCARGLSFVQLCLAHRETHPGWRGEGFHIFDSFEGLSAPVAEDLAFTDVADAAVARANMAQGHFAFALDVVRGNVHPRFPRVALHPGWIPQSLAAQPERTYRFVHLDVDLYEPTRGGLEYFVPRLAAGGMVVTDDYNWPGAKKAFDDFCRDAGLAVQVTDTSQAYAVKN
ncbi:MAG TPA: TylF/MycF/NovP-related O-methyltransferase [Burkholderiales bacterium]|nr:TylF/MycF/NovP-related O-methyltransferase [Burkholderiales bacterium]